MTTVDTLPSLSVARNGRDGPSARHSHGCLARRRRHVCRVTTPVPLCRLATEVRPRQARELTRLLRPLASHHHVQEERSLHAAAARWLPAAARRCCRAGRRSRLHSPALVGLERRSLLHGTLRKRIFDVKVERLPLLPVPPLSPYVRPLRVVVWRHTARCFVQEGVVIAHNSNQAAAAYGATCVATEAA